MNNYLNNAWYMAGWARDLQDTPLAREFLETPVVMFRDAAGAPAALYDMCPHRFAPLSRGGLVEGQVECGYHGLRFASDGRCTRNPWAGRIPPSAQVRLTPANRTSSHYFWGSGIRASESTVTDEAHLELVSQAFDVEDAPMLEAVQQQVGGNTDILAGKPQPVTLPGDTSAIHARNILKKLIKQERQTT